MKANLLVPSVVAIALLGTSFAATAGETNLSAKTKRYDAVQSNRNSDAYAQSPYSDWSGFYIGGNVGAGWAKSSTDALYTGLQNGKTYATNTDMGSNGWGSFGAQIGANKQYGMLVVGIEGDFQYPTGSIGDTASIHCPGLPATTACNQFSTNNAGNYTTLSQKMNWYSTARARAGMLALGNSFLFYGTGGVAVANIATDATITSVDTTSGNIFANSFNSSTTKAGWTLGGGVEFRLFGNWTGKVEYLHMDFGSVTTNGTLPRSCNACGPGSFPIAASFSSRVTDELVRVGFNYKFDSPRY